MTDHFNATLRQHYRLEDAVLLVLEDNYQGDVGQGDRLEIDMPNGEPLQFTVHDVAWGTAFQNKQVPVTLITKELRSEEPKPGAKLRSLERAANADDAS